MRVALSVSLAAALFGVTPAHAQRNFDAVEIKAQTVAPGIAVLFGAGGNIAVSHGPDGTVLIDDQFAPLTPKILAAIAALGATPPRFLINTHWHGDHTGGNENFGKAGTLILAHDHVRDRMSTAQIRGNGARVPPAPPAALPVLTWHHGATLHLNGDRVVTTHAPHAHTDGDSIVWWENANVVHMGDTFFNNGSMPFVDIASGGTARGLIAAADQVLAKANGATAIVPGHGAVATKADLANWRAMLVEIIDRVEAERKAGRTLEEVIAMRPTAKWATAPDAFIKGDAFVTAIWNSLDDPHAAQKAKATTGASEPHAHDGGKPHRH